MKRAFEPPNPVDGVDFYTADVRRYIVSIEIEVDGLYEDGEVDACSRAVDGFRDGSLDGDSTVMHSEKISEIELDFKTDLPFDRAVWQKAKLMEMGLNMHGEPLRPFEKVRPADETTLDMFMTRKTWLHRCVDWIKRFVKSGTIVHRRYPVYIHDMETMLKEERRD